MDNGSSVVARVPTGIAGPPRLTTNSEVATMTYCMADPYSSLLETVADMCADIFSYSAIQSLAPDTEGPGLER